MIQYNVHPDNYSQEEIVEIKKLAMLDTKIAILTDAVTAIQEITDDDIKFDLETKISQKLGRILDKF